MRPCPKASVNRAVGVEHEDRERLVSVELEHLQIQPVRGNLPDADELIQERANDRILIHQLIIQFHAFMAGNAP